MSGPDLARQAVNWDPYKLTSPAHEGLRALGQAERRRRVGDPCLAGTCLSQAAETKRQRPGGYTTDLFLTARRLEA